MLEPANLAASIYSLFAIVTVTPRMFLAKKGILTRATAIMALNKPGPSAATIANAKRIYGKAINTSTKRIIILSVLLP